MAYLRIPVEWCARVREARLHQEWTLERLARAARVSVTTLRRIESSQSSVRCQDTKWASILRCSALYETWTKEAALRQGGAALPNFIPPPSDTPPADVFLAVAMDSLRDSYPSSRQLTSKVLDALRTELGLTVFFPAESRPSSKDFEEEAWALADNCRALDRARSLLVVYPPPLRDLGKPLASSILIELGYGIARGLPTLVFYNESRQTLPFLLRSADAALPNFHLLRYRNEHDIILALRERHRTFFELARKRAAPSVAERSRGRNVSPSTRGA